MLVYITMQVDCHNLTYIWSMC